MNNSKEILKNNAQKLFEVMIQKPNEDLISNIVLNDVKIGFYTEFIVSVFLTKKAARSLYKNIINQRHKSGLRKHFDFDTMKGQIQSSYFSYANQLFQPYLTAQFYEAIQYIKPGIHTIVTFDFIYEEGSKFNDEVIDYTDRTINEETEGIDSFLMRIVKHFPQTERFIDNIRSFIEKSDCKKIEVARFKYPALGIALHNGVLFNEIMFYKPLETFLYIMFHEIAHQYQYKKYGDEKMYEFYMDHIEVEEAAKIMKQTELIADEFAIRKVREFVKLGFIKKPNVEIPKVYDSIPLSHFEQLINFSKQKIKEKGLTTPETIADTFYNIIKANR